MAGTLERRLGLGDAVMVGLGSMLGAGVFVAFAPAAAAAGGLLWLGLLVAAVVAYCNASSSAKLAALYPESGGTYVYGRERLGPFWGYLAGWAFVAGKVASCAAMALTVGAYLWPDRTQVVAAAAVLGITALNYRGVHKSALATRVIVAVVLLVLTLVVAQPGRVQGRAPGERSAQPPPSRRREGCCRQPASCSSRSPATPASPPSEKRSATRPAPFPGPSPWPWASRSPSRRSPQRWATPWGSRAGVEHRPARGRRRGGWPRRPHPRCGSGGRGRRPGLATGSRARCLPHGVRHGP